MAFYRYRSNRLERLAERLAEQLSQPLSTPLMPEQIVTASNGLARWLSLYLADQLGVCANIHFQRPAAFLWSVARIVLRQLPKTSRFDRPILHWRVMALLRDLEQTDCFAPVRAYLGTEEDDFRRHELAGQIAACFDQYLVYRPDWIQRWEAGEADHWQAELWRRLAQGNELHRVRAQARFLARLRSGDFDRSRLSSRVSIIGVTALPPLDVALLAALSTYLDVHLLLLDPCQEYWGDIQAERDLARLSEDVDPDEAYLTVGHPLLASMGKQGRDFLDLLHAYPCQEWEGFVEPESDCLLHRLHADILHLREAGDAEQPPWPLHPEDRSLQIHVCHSPMREVEVLHDQLLAQFAADPSLRPADVLVMTPDMARYGPLIEAVFASAPRARFIPFSIADRGAPAEEPLIEAWFALLDLSGGRLDASPVLDVLEVPAVRRRFDLDETDLMRIRQWTQQVGIRWGLDAATKARWDLPATPEHTWALGLDRLLLGYALPSDGQELYAGLLPYDGVEGGEAQALGGWRSFAEALFALDASLQERRPLVQWRQVLSQTLDQFFAPRDREEQQIQRVRDALEDLCVETERAEFTEAVSLAVVKSAVRDALNQAEGAGGRFLNGAVTCAALTPMRSLPFSVIALIGMNDGAYPRPRQPVDFDLMARQFRRGDRARRHDDRYLFLETLLSARRCLLISYVGRSVRDHTVLPPSVLVSELLDTVERSFQRPDGGSPSAQLTVLHPLQPFSRRYFCGDATWFSYAPEWLAASRQAGRGEHMPGLLLTTALPPADPALRQVTLEGLIHFFRHPARWLLRERLGVRPTQEADELATTEPFVLEGLENHQVLGRMLELHRAGQSPTAVAAILRAAGALPHGQVGDSVLEHAQDRVLRFAGRLGRLLPRSAPDPWDVTVQVGEFTVSGQLQGLTAAGLVGYRLASIKANDYLTCWLRHLILSLAAPTKEITPCSYWVAEDRLVELAPVEDAAAQLHALLAWYWQGVRRLLPFFPKSALSYAEARCLKQQLPDQALRAARRQWQGDSFGHLAPEGADVYYQLAFGGADPLDAEFEELALAVFGPVLTACSSSETSA